MAKPMDRERAAEIRNSPHWNYIVEELEYRIMLRLNLLRTCTEEGLSILQHEIEVLEEIKRLPDDVADREDMPESGAP